MKGYLSGTKGQLYTSVQRSTFKCYNNPEAVYRKLCKREKLTTSIAGALQECGYTFLSCFFCFFSE